MDYRGLVAGYHCVLSVLSPAVALCGDGHAVQGDGEIGGMGIEISMDVCLRVRIVQGLKTRWPRACRPILFTMGNARPLDQALQHATTELMHWLDEAYGLDATAASILLTRISYDIGNVFDPAYTVVARIERRS